MAEARNLPLIAIGVCIALLCSPAGRAQATRPSCLPVAVDTTGGTFSYTVRIESGAVTCAIARQVARDAADWPVGAAGWRCTIGQHPDSWAFSCAHGAAVVDAYGPTRERSPWVTAEAKLRIGLLEPRATLGLVLRSVRVRSCGTLRPWVVADYERVDGATLTVGEGRPSPCANLGVAPRLAVWRIHGNPALLFEFCSPSGCARLWGDYALDWREGDVGITLLTHGLAQGELLSIAQSMAAVPA